MKIIRARNVNEALGKGMLYLATEGRVESSRNGDALVAPCPVVTEYDVPTERVLFCPLRNANPFFHMMEALWMLNGGNDLAWPVQFNRQFKEYSDDGIVINGAYGHRWRYYFDRDQIAMAIQELRLNPTSRRVVIGMWDPAKDLGLISKDVPCNTHIYFMKRGVAGREVLDMTVCNRSNDILWGAYGANAVHMSMLHEVVALSVGIAVGSYYQISNNYHLYTAILPAEQIAGRCISAIDHNYYATGAVSPYPLITTDWEDWSADLDAFMGDPAHDWQYNEPFFEQVARPMYLSWAKRKSGEGDGMEEAKMIQATDWRLAVTQWIERRRK